MSIGSDNGLVPNKQQAIIFEPMMAQFTLSPEWGKRLRPNGISAKPLPESMLIYC